MVSGQKSEHYKSQIQIWMTIKYTVEIWGMVTQISILSYYPNANKYVHIIIEIMTAQIYKTFQQY